MKSTYITTTLPYVNAAPHVGFALEIVQADAFARFKRLSGHEVFFNFGTDEHGQKVLKVAEKEGLDPQKYTDELAPKFNDLKEALNLSYDNFIRTTDEHHISAAQHIWKLCDQNGDIYKKKYTGLYCVSCERFVKESECLNGKCPDHPEKDLEEVEEENYFFKFSKYGDFLLDYLENKNSVTPEWRRQEAINFVKNGLEDFPVSRLKSRMPWGISVPRDDEQVMYVWFDALTNYISTLGWPEDKNGNFEKFWNNGEVVQFAGKDQIRFQSLIWQAMLKSASIKNTDKVFYHGFINIQGEKISKSVGNVVDPQEIVKEFGTDALRYYLLRHISPVEDSNFSLELLTEAYNGNLANGLGNLFSRIMKMYVDYNVSVDLPDKNKIFSESDTEDMIGGYIEKFEFNKALDCLWEDISNLDFHIQETKPFKVVEENKEKAKEIVKGLVRGLYEIAVLLEPFLPDSAEMIQNSIKNKTFPKPLFPRR